MALKDAIDVFERQPPMLGHIRERLAGLERYRLALADTARSLRRTHATLHLTRPLTGRPDTDAAVAATLAAFPAALTRITARPVLVGATVDNRFPRAERAGASPPTGGTATPTEAVAGGIAALQRLGLRARLYADELLRAEIHLSGESGRLLPLAALLGEFGEHCDALSYQLQPARQQMAEALNGLDSIGAGRGALSHLARSCGGAYTAVHADAAERFLAERPERRAAFTTHVGRAIEAYADADTSRDLLAAGLRKVHEALTAT
jgi:hypothetical protein